jgi:hypothetical protein
MKSLLLGLAAVTVCVRSSHSVDTNEEWTRNTVSAETGSVDRRAVIRSHPLGDVRVPRELVEEITECLSFEDMLALARVNRFNHHNVFARMRRQYRVDRALFNVICLPMPQQSRESFLARIEANYARSQYRVCGITEDGTIRMSGQSQVQREFPRVRVSEQPIMDGEEFILTEKERDGIAMIRSVTRDEYSEPRLNVATAYTPSGNWQLLPGRRVCENNDDGVVSVIKLDTSEVELRYIYDWHVKGVTHIMDHFVVFFVPGTRQLEFFPLWQHSTEPAYTLRFPQFPHSVAGTFFTWIDDNCVLHVLSLQPDNIEQFCVVLPQGFDDFIGNQFGLCAVHTDTHYVLFDLRTRLQLGPTRVGEFSHFHLSLPHCVFEVVNPDESHSLHSVHDCATALCRIPNGSMYDGGYVDTDKKLKLQVQTDEASPPE